MIEKLEFLIAVARERNFHKAAEACGVAQPTLSAGIKSLEDTLGVLLIRRTSRFQSITPEGERVLEWARRLVGDARAMRLEARSFRHGLTGALRLAAIPTALPFTPTITQSYCAQHPNVRFTILSRSSTEILDQLHDLQVDAGLTYVDRATSGRMRAIPLYVERYCLVASAGSYLAGRKSLTWAEVSALPLCLFTGDLQNRRILDQLLHPGVRDSQPYLIEADSTITLLAHVRAGALSTVVSKQVSDLLAGATAFCIIPITGNETAFTVGLVVLDRDPMSPNIRALTAIADKLSSAGV